MKYFNLSSDFSERFRTEVEKQFLETLFWSETDDNGFPLDENYSESDIVDEVREKISEDVGKFLSDNADVIRDLDLSAWEVGHNFVLSRNHHGTGFWDRGYGDQGDLLHESSDGFGTMSLYVGGDGKIYGA